MSRAPCRLTGPIGSRATLGLIVLQADETIEHDFRRLCPVAGVALHVTRIPSGADPTPDTIAAMEAALPRAASLLPPAAFGSVGYACTSGTTLIGAERVAALVAGAVSTAAVADPLSAAIAAMRALGLRSVGLVTPYVDSVAGPIRTAFEAAGLTVPAAISFGEQVEARVARIDADSIRDAARAVARAPGVEAVFLSCTNLRTLDIIDDLETRLDLPVLGSNLCLAWQMFQQAGLVPDGATDSAAERPGRLLRGVPARP